MTVHIIGEYQMPKRLNKIERELKNKIILSLKSQGFKINPHLRPPQKSKIVYKRIQKRAKHEQIQSSKKFLSNFFKSAKELSVDGGEIDPEEISLELREVTPNSFEAKLFRWWNLVWWSMPYQNAYGRQMRFFLWDVTHDAPFGMFLLQSPILRLTARDEFLNIPRDSLDYWVNMSMSAQRVGALPPYNELIGGKMVALAMTSNEIRKRYSEKYRGRITLMSKRELRPDLLFITTTSAFGKSSMYDRLKYRGNLAALPIGYTKGSGTFHLSDTLTKEMYTMLQRREVNTNTSFGHGPSRKLKLFRQSFAYLGLKGFHSHGIKREVYLFPLVKNLDEVIHKRKKPAWYDRSFDDVERFWKERWAVPRSRRMPGWQEFDSKKFFKQLKSTLKI